jgi:hypothetical protein
MTMRKLSASAVALVTFVFVPDASGGWTQPVGGNSPVNRSASQSASDPSIATLGGVPHVAWSEPDGTNTEIRVARLNPAGNDWVEPWFELQGGIRQPTATDGMVLHNLDEHGTRPKLAVIAGTLWVAWLESDVAVPENKDVRVARLVTDLNSFRFIEPAADANDVDGAINFSQNEETFDVDIASVGGVPHVTWSEDDGNNTQVRVARFNEATDTWDHLNDSGTPATDGGVNIDPTAIATSGRVTDVGGVPHVAWREFDGNTHARVARWSGTAWQELSGGSLNRDQDANAFIPHLTEFDGRVYAAWLEDDGNNAEVRAARRNAAGTGWEAPWDLPTYGGINRLTDMDAEPTGLVPVDGRLYVTWQEEEIDGSLANTRIRAARLRASGAIWEHVVPGLSPISAPTLDASRPDLAGVGTVPWVTWTEGPVRQVKVARLEPEFGTLTAASTSDSATLGVGVTTFGVRFPVGFQHGAANENETATQLTPLDVNSTTVTANVSGLTPSTTFSFRAFATAGVPLPRVFTGSGTFSTAAVPTPPAGGGPPAGGDPPGAGGGGGGGPGPVVPPADRTAAVFSNLALSPASFRAAGSGASVAGTTRRRARVGTRVTYALDEAATVTFTVEKMSKGRRVGGRCRKETRSNRRRPRCTLITAVRGSFTHAGKVGGNRLTFRGRVGGRKLGVGSYRLNARAADAAGNRSPVARRNFKIVRR